jgi:SAM-dependent methyltransferase
MQLLFAVTLFLSAFLLFLVQPLVGRMLLPLLGGAPAVWNTCMVFFQAALLAGYAYSHLVTARLGRQSQLALHAIMLALPIFVLPVAIPGDAARSAAGTEYPVILLLKALLLGVGLPFFVIATTGPLLQRWFATTGHVSERDPYFLYAASNLGSMLALLSYPSLVEPLLNLSQQRVAWAVGYGLFAIFVSACGLAVWRAPRSAEPPTTRPGGFNKSAVQEPKVEITWLRRVRWLSLAFVPSSLLLGTTTYITTDLTPIPLLWIAPLAIYLLSFILVFAGKPPLPHAWMNRILPIAVIMLTLVLLTGATELRELPAGILVGLHLFALFIACMVAHGELARDRPAPAQLTEFYLWLAAGGVLGGVFNALVAPILFHRTGLTEYPLALVLACFIMRPRSEFAAREPGKPKGYGRGKRVAPRNSPAEALSHESDRQKDISPRKQLVLDIVEPMGIGAITLGLVLLAVHLELEAGPVRTGIMFGLPCVLAYLLVDRPVRFGLAVAAVLLARDPDQALQHLERNFFGVLKITEMKRDGNARFRALTHGSTIHGEQRLDQLDDEGRHEPLTYYHRFGPIGHVYRDWVAPRRAGQRIGVVGLGTGSLAYYARAGDAWTFYEIDPAVKRIAEDPRWFSFLAECRTETRDFIVGDARLKLAEAPPGKFDLLVLDAFSSDAIPVHLLTQEAMQLYVDKLADGGLIAFHVSNRYLNLQPILAKLAQSTGPKLAARHWEDENRDLNIGRFPSQWIILAKSEADLGALAKDARWEKLTADASTPLWTDDFSNILSAVQW